MKPSTSAVPENSEQKCLSNTTQPTVNGLNEFTVSLLKVQRKYTLNNQSKTLFRNLFQAICKKSGPDDNFLLSPASVAVVMLMINAGARHNTSQQIKKALYLENVQDDAINAQMNKLLKTIKVF